MGLLDSTPMGRWRRFRPRARGSAKRSTDFGKGAPKLGGADRLQCTPRLQPRHRAHQGGGEARGSGHAIGEGDPVPWLPCLKGRRRRRRSGSPRVASQIRARGGGALADGGLGR